MSSSTPRPSPRPRRTVFYSVAAQWDNLGDIEIRNAALGWIRATDSDVIAYAGSMPAAYLAAFDIDERVRFVTNPVRYQALLWQYLVRRRASIVFAPGPQVFGPSARAIGKSLINLANVAAVRTSGGAVLAVGRSLRGRGRLARRVEAAVVAMFQLYVVRDTRSAEVLGEDLASAPDLAFAHSFSDGTTVRGRTNVVISLRGDRPIAVDGLKAVVGHLRDKGLNPVLVTQVKRDDDQHRAIGDALDVPTVLWGNHSHAEQLERARTAYAQAGAVLSNRLHALIFGIQHGASPIAVLDHASDKLTSTLRPWVDLRTTSPSFDGPSDVDWANADIVGLSGTVEVEAEQARAALAGVQGQFSRLLGVTEVAPVAEVRV
ncbi:polysaccharide pyruvyl transferase family protein [Cryobacterium adonitolivorans]|uniref:Polysaccharide pyruvyl transferase family protein n=1 Tax=Cryobacterium adonitolivorans TaxID=1259189 RepID=A0A4R8WA64_9MICO|nr:polysaccharide pyruvyl transferase family protein [Cryobacterium adonitolivorans]TFC05570.1 polysaccharide pyruvyl transferase family protein [Cryobacterium adonitolivorans]